MKTTLFSVLAFGACASLAIAEPLPPAPGTKDPATAEAHPTGPVALTEAEMDKVAAGALLLPAIQAAREAASSTSTYMKITMTDVIISSYQTGN
jgi:hypothetical protein